METLSPEAFGLLFNLLSPDRRNALFDLLRDLAKPESGSPDAPDPEKQTNE